jgi:hypothetical protein
MFTIVKKLYIINCVVMNMETYVPYLTKYQKMGDLQKMPLRKAKLEAALKHLAEAATEYANVLDELGYEATHAPEYMEDADDFAYEIQSFVEDEIETLNENKIVEVQVSGDGSLELKIENDVEVIVKPLNTTA